MKEVITEWSGHYSFYTVIFIRNIFHFTVRGTHTHMCLYIPLRQTSDQSPSQKKRKRNCERNASNELNITYFCIFSLHHSVLFTWPLLVLFFFSFRVCLIYYGKILCCNFGAMVECMQFWQQPTLTWDLENFLNALSLSANISSLPSSTCLLGRVLFFSCFVHFLNCLRLLEDRPFCICARTKFHAQLLQLCECKQLLVGPHTFVRQNSVF